VKVRVKALETPKRQEAKVLRAKGPVPAVKPLLEKTKLPTPNVNVDCYCNH
jgi:hypothetical protein